MWTGSGGGLRHPGQARRRPAVGRALRRLRDLLALELFVPKDEERVAFVVLPGQIWSGNLRAVAEHLLAESDVSIVVVDALGTEVEFLRRLYGSKKRVLIRQGYGWAYGRCATVVISHNSRRALLLPSRVARQRRVLIWHGIGFKSIGHAQSSPPSGGEPSGFRRSMRRVGLACASSDVDRERLVRMFGIHRDRIAVTGYPRTDWIVAPRTDLPADLAADDEHVRQLLVGRSLVLFAPTWEPLIDGHYDLEAVIATLTAQAREQDAILGVRLHPAVQFHRHDVDWPEGAIDLARPTIRSAEVILRHTDVLVTDYSSIWVDALVAGSAILGFVPDLAGFRDRRGLDPAYEERFPGELCRGLEEARVELSRLLGSGSALERARERSRRLVSTYHLAPLGAASRRAAEVIAPGSHS